MKLLENKKLWIIVGLIAIFFALSQTSLDQKTSPSEWGGLGFGLTLIILGIIAIMSIGGAPIGVFLLIFGIIALGGFSVFKGLAGIFTPDSVIPGWVWLVAIGALVFMVIGRKK